MFAAPPVLVFAHYFGGSARSWAPLLAALGGAFEGIAPDLPGFGGATPLAGGQNLDGCADWLEAQAAGRPWIAVGHSMGGKIALAAATRRPATLKGLILIAPSPPRPEPIEEADRQDIIASFGERAAAAARLEEITAGSLGSTLFAACVDDEVRVSRAAWLWWLERGSRDDISARTAGLDLPVLVITGDHDKVLGPNTAFQVAAGLQRATIQVISGGGHLVPLEQPAAVAGLMRNFAPALAMGPA